jgi:hypothetical protein
MMSKSSSLQVSDAKRKKLSHALQQRLDFSVRVGINRRTGMNCFPVKFIPDIFITI